MLPNRDLLTGKPGPVTNFLMYHLDKMIEEYVREHKQAPDEI